MNQLSRTLRWYSITEDDAVKLYAPTLKVMGARDIKRLRKYGPIDGDFYYYEHPNTFEYQQALKITIYCTFEFTTFPFDSHICDFNFGSSNSFIYVMVLDQPWIRFRNQRVIYGEGKLLINQSRLPFDIYLESMDPFEHTEAGYNYSYSKMKIYMNRNDLGYLFGSFYGPTGMFAGLSLISYAINPDIVSNIILMNYKLMGVYKKFFSTC